MVSKRKKGTINFNGYKYLRVGDLLEVERKRLASLCMCARVCKKRVVVSVRTQYKREVCKAKLT